MVSGVWTGGVGEGLRAYSALNVGLGVFVDALGEFGVFGGAGGGMLIIVNVEVILCGLDVRGGTALHGLV